MTPGNGYQTPSKLLKDGAKDGVSSLPPTPLLPVVRSALDIVADLYVLVPEIKSYVRHMVTSGSFLFLKSYIMSVDPKTVISAVNFVSNIISDFSTSNNTGDSVAENEKKLDVIDIKEFYLCAVERLQLYCKIREDSAQRTATKYSRFTNNTISNQDVKSDDEGNESNKKDEMEIDDPGITEKATSEKPFGDVVSVSDKARDIVLQPLIRSLSILINKCLRAADALSFDEQRKFYSMKKSDLSGLHTSICLNARVLLWSMGIAFRDLILAHSAKRENKIMSSEEYGNENNDSNIVPVESRNDYCEDDGIKNRNIVNDVSDDDKTNKMTIEERDEIFDGFVSRKRQLILTIQSSISLLRSHTILQTGNAMKERKLRRPQQCQKTLTSLSNFALESFDLEIEYFYGFFTEKEIPFSLAQKVFLPILIQGGINATKFFNSVNEDDQSSYDNHAGESSPSTDRTRLLRLFYQEIKNSCVNKEEIVIDNDDIFNTNTKKINNDNNNNESNDMSNNKNRMKISTSNSDNIKVQTNDKSNNNGDASNNMNKSMSMNVKSDSNKNDYDCQGSDESQNSCLLTLTCLGATSLTNTTNKTRNSTCENIQKCRTNCNSPEKIVSCSVKNVKQVIKSENKNSCENEINDENGHENFECQNLSTAFTPAHSKNRQIFDNEDDSGILSPSCADQITENNEENESFQNSESTVFNIEINHDDNKIDNERENDIKSLKNNRLSDINKIEQNVHQESKTNNTASEENKNMKKLLISDNVKRFEDDDTLDLTNMSIADCSSTMTVAVTGGRVSQTRTQSVILSQSKPLVASIPAPVSFPLSIPSSLPNPVTVHVKLPFSSPVPALTSPTLAVILTETKASANALRHTLSYVPVSIQSVHQDSAATASTATSTSSHSSSSSSCSSSCSSSSPHSSTQQSTHLNGYTGSTVSEEENLNTMDCVSRLRNVLSASDVTATQLEMKSICEENLLLKKLRDSSLVDRMSQQAAISALHFESAGNKSRQENSANEIKSNIVEIENLKFQIDEMKITLMACEERKVEQENLLQEAWVRLSQLAKKESATLLLNAQLTGQASNASNRATAAALELVECKGRLEEKNSIVEFLQSQIDEREKVQKKLLTEKLMMEDRINESIRKNGLFASKLKSYESEWEKEMKISNERNERITRLGKELKEMKSNYSDLKIQNENLIEENGAIKEEIEESKYSVMKLEERALEAEEASKEWEEKCTALERTHAEHSLKQKEREESLLEELKENIRRGDNAENDLLKHKELISFINKLSTEGGEAGRAKARRLSEALCSDSMKSQNKENVYKHNNNSYTDKDDSTDHNDNNNSISNKKSNNAYVDNDTDAKYDSVSEERSRKVRKPSKQA